MRRLPFAKPVPRPKKRRAWNSTLPQSDTRLPRATKPIARSKPVPKKKRTPSEFARIYGSKARVAWVKALPCAACGYAGPVLRENAHTKTGGVGRKADARWVAPLCVTRPSHLRPNRVEGCHNLLHRVGRQTLELQTNVHLETAAGRTELAWQAHLNGSGE